MNKEIPRQYQDKILRYEVRTYLEERQCGACSLGRMRPSGEPNEGKTPHTCERCGRTIDIEGNPYPRTVIERIQRTAG